MGSNRGGSGGDTTFVRAGGSRDQAGDDPAGSRTRSEPGNGGNASAKNKPKRADDGGAPGTRTLYRPNITKRAMRQRRKIQPMTMTLNRIHASKRVIIFPVGKLVLLTTIAVGIMLFLGCATSQHCNSIAERFHNIEIHLGHFAQVNPPGRVTYTFSMPDGEEIPLEIPLVDNDTAIWQTKARQTSGSIQISVRKEGSKERKPFWTGIARKVPSATGELPRFHCDARPVPTEFTIECDPLVVQEVVVWFTSIDFTACRTSTRISGGSAAEQHILLFSGAYEVDFRADVVAKFDGNAGAEPLLQQEVHGVTENGPIQINISADGANKFHWKLLAGRTWTRVGTLPESEITRAWACGYREWNFLPRIVPELFSPLPREFLVARSRGFEERTLDPLKKSNSAADCYERIGPTDLAAGLGWWWTREGQLLVYAYPHPRRQFPSVLILADGSSAILYPAEVDAALGSGAPLSDNFKVCRQALLKFTIPDGVILDGKSATIRVVYRYKPGEEAAATIRWEETVSIDSKGEAILRSFVDGAYAEIDAKEEIRGLQHADESRTVSLHARGEVLGPFVPGGQYELAMFIR